MKTHLLIRQTEFFFLYHHDLYLLESAVFTEVGQAVLFFFHLRAHNQHVDYSGAYNWGCSLWLQKKKKEEREWGRWGRGEGGGYWGGGGGGGGIL